MQANRASNRGLKRSSAFVYPSSPVLAPLVAFAFALALGPAAAIADEAPADTEEPIEQIVVVAHKLERSIREVAANVTVLDRAALKGQLATSTSDVFRYVPGIDYEAAGSRFGTEGINIRGIGGNRVAILVDGVPLSDQFDVGSFSNATRDFLDTGLVRNIEVLHGPASALYGSAAIGGVVAVATPDPGDILDERPFGGDALVTWRGEDASWHGTGQAAFGGETAGVLIGGSFRDGEQIDAAASDLPLDTRDYRRRTGLVKFVADDRRGNTWRASVLHQDAQTDSSLTSMLGSGRFRSTTALLGDDRYRSDMLHLALEFGSPGTLFEDGIVRAYVQDAEVEQTTLDERGNARTPVSIDRYFSFEQRIAGIEINLRKDFTTGSVEHRLGFGAEYRERRTEEYRDGLSTNLQSGEQTNVLLGESFPLRDFPISRSTESAAYVEDSMSIGNWTVIAALRGDRFELDPEQDPMYLEDYPFAELVTIDESQVSPKLGFVYAAGPSLDVYAQYSHGFRAPPFADANIGLEIPFFNYRAIPNPDLKSESSDGIDLGLRLTQVNATARLSVFHTRYEDFIESKVRLGEDPVSGRVLFQSQNLRSTTIEGLEGAFSWRFGGDRRAWSVDASAYFARGENDSTGEPLNSVGPPQAVVGFGWTSASNATTLGLKTTLTGAWDERDETGGELFKPDGYVVHDLFLTQALGANTALRVGLHNLSDETYWHWSDIRGLAPDDPIIPYLSRAGRSVSASFNVYW